MKKNVNFDEYTDNYNQLLSESTNFFSPNEKYFARYKVDVVKNYINLPSQSKILEYGCGIGRNISFLATSFPHSIIHGSDISEVGLEYARKLNPNVYFFNENDKSIPSVQYDLIFVAGVFHHIAPEMRNYVIDAIYKRLKPGGDIFIFEHNPFNPITKRIVDRCPYDEDAILLRPSELRSRFTNARFEIIKQSYCLFIPPSLVFMLPLEKYLQWLPLGGQYWTHARRLD